MSLVDCFELGTSIISEIVSLGMFVSQWLVGVPIPYGTIAT